MDAGDHRICDDRSLCEGDVIWKMKELAGRDPKILSITPRMLEDAQDPVEVDTLRLSIGSTIKAVTAGKEDIRDHRVPCFETRYIRSGLNNHPCWFVSHDERKFRSIPPTLADMKIRSTDATRLGMDKDVVRTDLGHGNIFYS
jgi:hypothetical protein